MGSTYFVIQTGGEASMSGFDKDGRAFDDEGIARHIEKALAVESPSETYTKNLYRMVKWAFDPVVIGGANLPDKPCLFIGNHSLFALDGFVFLPLMMQEFGRFLRPMSDKFQWHPQTEDFLLKQGAVIGDPKVCTSLMENGKDILVFPGGAHEAVKSSAQKYQLQWKQRYGFIKLAAMNGYTIMPFSLVGPDEFYSHWVEGQDLPDTPVGGLLKKFGLLDEDTRPDLLPPIPRGSFGSLIPKPQRCFLQFGTAVDLSDSKGKELSRQKLQAIRTGISDQIETMLGELLILREQRRGEEGLLRRLMTI